VIFGCDFTSSPTARKPIVVACGKLDGAVVRVEDLHHFPTLGSFQEFLCAAPPWIGGFDFPFGLPRELVETLGWPQDWAACLRHYAGLSRSEIRTLFKAFCDSRPVGQKFAHRVTDGPAKSSPSMKWVNPPVAYMLHVGVPLLRELDCHFPGLQPGNRQKVALEAYPGLLAREILGSRSYKNDAKAKQTPERAEARQFLVTQLAEGKTRLGLRLECSHHDLVSDATGDSLDAALCLMQASWGSRQPNYGIPDCDGLEGWIVTAPH
jgi:hypothetical protein